VTAKDVGKGISSAEVVEDDDDDDEALSLSAFSDFLSEHMTNEYYKKGDVIYREGDKGHDMIFLNSGVVEVTNKAGFRTTLKQGDFAGEGALLSNNRPRSGTVTCITPTHAIKITKEYFDKYLSTSDSGLSLKMLEKDKDRETSRIIFSAFSDLLSENMKNEIFQGGDVVYAEGDKGHDMFFINSGVVEVTNKDGFRTTLQQGDFVGEGALLNNKPRSGSVVCLTPVHGMKITKEYFDKYLASSDSGLSLTMHQKDRDRSLSRSKMVLRKQKSLNRLVFSSGEFLFKEGDLTKSLYIMDEGIAEVVVGEHAVLRVNPGDICGEHSVIFNRPRNASARCLSGKCKVLEIPLDAFHDLLESSSPSLKDSIKDACLRKEFQTAVVFKTKKDFPRTTASLRDAFVAVTANDIISLEVMSLLLRNMNPDIPDKEIKGVFDSLDLEGRGSIDFKTFKQIFGVH
jgi:CRP-like cAMP-binding protein